MVGSKRKSKIDVNSYQILLQLLIKSRKKIASRVDIVNKIKGIFVQATEFLIEFGTQVDWNRFGGHITQSLNLFLVFIDAVMSVSGQGLLR